MYLFQSKSGVLVSIIFVMNKKAVIIKNKETLA
jgi:hypothetical protein